MAAGTGNLPNQNMVFTPFDILTAAEQNQLVENIESLADGTGIGDDAVTPEKRSGGFWQLNYTFSETGSINLTNVPFRPKAINVISRRVSGTAQVAGQGMATDNNGVIMQGAQSSAQSNTGVAQTIDSTTAAFLVSGSTSTDFVGQVTSFNEDGITVNVTTSSGGVSGNFSIQFFG